jgi:hypothetical protein
LNGRRCRLAWLLTVVVAAATVVVDRPVPLIVAGKLSVLLLLAIRLLLLVLPPGPLSQSSFDVHGQPPYAATSSSRRIQRFCCQSYP